MTTNLSSKFRFIAWGFTIQLILAVFMIIVALSVRSSWSYMSTIRTCSTIAMIGSLVGTALCIYGSFSMTGDLAKRRIPTSGALMCGISFSLNFIMSIISQGTSLISTSVVAARSEGMLIASLLMTVISLILIITGVTHLSRYVRGLSTARNGYYTVVIAALIVVILAFIASNASHRTTDSLAVFGLICALAIIVGYIMVITGWWASVGGASEIDAYDGDAAASDNSQASSVGNSAFSANAAEIAAYRDSLRQLDDQQLNYIVMNPAAYKPEFVAEATSMLVKRQSWEKLQGLTDQQLLDMINAGTAVHSAEECDVASMILYSRKSPLFVSQFAGLTPAELTTIVNNPANYYEGYVEQARELLNR